MRAATIGVGVFLAAPWVIDYCIWKAKGASNQELNPAREPESA